MPPHCEHLREVLCALIRTQPLRICSAPSIPVLLSCPRAPSSALSLNSRPHAPALLCHTHTELQELPAAEREEALRSCGLGDAAVEEVATFLATLPTVYCRAECEVGGAGWGVEGCSLGSDSRRARMRGQA